MFHFRSPKSYEEQFIKKAKKFGSFEVKAYEEFAAHLQKKARPVSERRLGLKLLLISDTHCEIAFHKSAFAAYVEENHEFDLCVLLGDLHPKEVDIILELIPRSKIIAIKGNHDVMDQYSSRHITEISGTTFTCKDVTIAGIEGSFKYKQENFPAFTQYESLLLAKQMLQSTPKTDIPITHDSMFKNAMANHAHVGLIGISYYIYASSIQWHFHGHIHRSSINKYENGTREKSVYLYEIIEI